MNDAAITRTAIAIVDSRLNSLSRMLRKPWSNRGSASSTATGLGPSAGVSQPIAEPTVDVGAAITFTGDVSGHADLFVRGTVEGSIKLCCSNAIVERSGHVGGPIRARQVQIRGTVIGDIEALEKITIMSDGKVEGRVTAPRICVEDGAKFNGVIEIRPDGVEPAPCDQLNRRHEPLRSGENPVR